MPGAGPGTGDAERLPMLALVCANAVSSTGDMAALVAVPWFVLEVTGSAAKTGLTGAALATGTILSGVFAGPVVDRLGFKRTSVAADLASGATTAAIPLLYLNGMLQFWALLALVLLGSVLDTPGYSARSALVPGLAARAGTPLERANSIFGAVPRLALLVGTPLAGALIAAFGAAEVLLLDAATFLVSATLVAFSVPSPEAAPDQRETGGVAGYLADLGAGASFVVKSPLVLSLVLVVTFVNLIDEPLVSVVLPVYAKTNWESAAGLGLLLGAVGAGALAGTAAFGALGHYLPRRPTFLLAILAGGGIEYLALLASPSLALAVAAFALGGFLFGPLDPIFSTVLQERAPEDMLGRLFGLSRALATAGAPLGLVAGGFLVEGAGLNFTLFGMAGLSLTLVLGMWLNPALRGMDTPEKADAGVSPASPSNE